MSESSLIDTIEEYASVTNDAYTDEDRRATFSQPTMIWEGVAQRALEQIHDDAK